MSDLVHARFLPMFLATARTHVEKGLEHVSRGEAEKVMKTLRTIAGDASLLSVHSVETAARKGEAAARNWANGPRNDGERLLCVRSLEAVSEALDELEHPQP